MEFIESPQDIYDWHNKLGIRNMQVSCDIQIVNCTYGYSRIVADPKNNKNPNWPQLKLNAYDKNKEGTANLVYGAKLDTEGILFEIDQAKIIEWLRDNNIIQEEQVPDLHDELAVKRWFAENVHGDLISMFGEIEGDEAITKNVFGLLHSMSHAFIQAAGEISGLSSNSLTEIIFVETASIFIYSQTSQGVPLGALSGMAEMRYEYFLRRVFEDTKNCIFDPVCTERDDTACHACLIIPEISCNHFNAGLIDYIRDVRAYFILTNAYHPEIAKIFEGKGEMLTYDRTCNIGGKAARRGKVQEYIFTNIPGVKREEAEE